MNQESTISLKLSQQSSIKPFLALAALITTLLLHSLFFILTQPAQAALGINQQINFQARLFNAAGAVVPDGNYNIEFKIYQDGDGCNPTSGTPPCGGTLKWTEAWLNNNNQPIQVRNGYFSVQLGTITALSAVDFNQSVNWLSMNVGNTNPTCTPFSSCSGDGEMKPFQRFGANAYSFNSDKLDGLDNTQFTQLAQGLQTDASTANASIAINKTGTTANILTLQRGGADVQVIANDGSALFKNQTDSATGFRIQSATAAQTLFTADTTANKIKIGDSTGTDTSTTLLQVDSTTADPTTLTSRNGGLFYNSTLDQLKVIEAGAVARVCTTTAVCSGYAPSAANGYVQLAPASVQVDASTNNSIYLNKTGASGNIVQLQKGGADKFVVDNAGNVGIGTATPTTKLQVVGGLTQSLESSSLTYLAETQGTTPGTTLDGAFGVFVSGRYAYVANAFRDSLAVIDISNTGSPTFIAETQGTTPGTTLDGAFSVFVSGKYAYVANSDRDSLAVIDISNPASPTFIAETQGTTPGTTLDGAAGVFVSGKYAYVTNLNRDSMAVIDISNPASPTFIAETQGTTPGTTLDGAFGVFVSGKYAYVTNTNRDSLAVIDISNPASPTFIAETQGTTPGTTLNGAFGVFVSGKYAYVANVSRDSLAVIDISNPASPTFIAETQGTTPGTTLDGAFGVFVSGKYAYVTNLNRDSMAVIDISNPASPTFIAETQGATPGTTLDGARNVFVSGKYAYVTNLNHDSLAAIDIGGTDLSTLSVGSVTTGSLNVDTIATFANGIQVAGGLQVADSAVIQRGLTVQGAGSTSSTNALDIVNSTGTNLLRVTDAGSVGIGTAAPSVKLDVIGSIQASVDLGNLTPGSLGQRLEVGDTTITTLRFDADNYRIYAGGTGGAGEVLRVTESGNVGIGTSGPMDKLEISGSLRLSDPSDSTHIFRVNPVSGFGANFPRTLFQGGDSTSDTNWVMRFADAYSSSSTAIPAGIQLTTNNDASYTNSQGLQIISGTAVHGISSFTGANGAGLPIHLETSGPNLSATPNLYLDTVANGNRVGIGTNAPGAKLHVQGGDMFTLNSGGNPRLVLGDTASAGDWGSIRWDSTNDQLQLGTNTGGVSTLSISEVGNVGIGQTNPTSILHTVATGAKTATYTGNLLTNTATSSTTSINKYGLEIQSTGTWNGTSANNVGLYVSSVTGGTNNYDAVFNGGGNVGIGLSLADLNGASAYGFQVNQNTLFYSDLFKVRNYLGSTDVLQVNTTGTNGLGVNVTAAVTADLSFGNASDRTINVLTAGSGAGNNLTLTAGAAASGNNNGGDLHLRGGVSTGSGIYGDVILQSLGGNVGIGTAGPASVLHVSSAAVGTDLFKVTDTTATAQDVLKIADGGAVNLRNQTDSTTSFQVQNAAAAQLLNVDSTDSNITLLGNNSGEPKAWTTTTALGTAHDNAGSVSYNGHMYLVTGDSGGALHTTVAYSKLNADGTLNAWATTGTSMPTRNYAAVTQANGYIYVIGGTSVIANTDVRSEVYYAKINQDGTVGTFATTSALTNARKRGTAVILNGYIYHIGGDSSANATPAAVDDVYYAKLNADGTVGTWSLVSNGTNGLPAARYAASAITANGLIYVLGGAATGGAAQTSVYYVRPLSTGDISSAFTAEGTNPLAAARYAGGVYIANGYVYYAGGQNAGTQPTVHYSPLNANGSLGTWVQQNTANDLPANRESFAYASANGYFYAIGGWTGSGAATTAYHTSTTRVRIGGSLDLIGIGGENLAEGGTGGNLTAGNTQIVGSLQVTDMANFLSSVTVERELRVGGSVLFKNLTNSTTAFQVQNSTGASLLNVDSTNGNVGIGTTAPTEKLSVVGNIQIGAQTNATTAFAKQTQTTAGTIAASGTAAIDKITSSAVLNGSLYVGTSKANAAEIYRFDGGTTWTKVSQATAGTIASGGTASIDAITTMTVWNGKLYIGTSEADKAEVYRFDGGTTWTVINPTSGNTTVGCTTDTAGFFRTGGNTCKIDTVSSMIVFGGQLHIGTTETDNAELFVYQGGSTWMQLNPVSGEFDATTAIDGVTALAVYETRLIIGVTEPNKANVYIHAVPAGSGGIDFYKLATDGQIANSGDTAVDTVSSLSVYNGMLYIGTTEANKAEIVAHNGYDGELASQTTSGTIASGGTAAIDGVTSMSVYNGRLYAGTSEANAAEVYRFDNGRTWTKVSNATAGTIAASGTANIDSIPSLQAYSGSLWAFTNESASAEGYNYADVSDQSYALKFRAPSGNAGGEQNGLQNEASISFLANQTATSLTGNSPTGAFLFSNSIATTFGGYDVAEDFPTRDDSLAPGDVVAIDPTESGMVRKARAGDAILGIYSKNPGLRLSQADAQINGARAIPVALAGRVPVKVDKASAPIKAGDLLAASQQAGYAQRATRAGTMVGKALEDWSPGKGQDTVMVFVGTSYADPTESNLQGSTASFEALNVAGEITAGSLSVTGTTTTRDLAVSGAATIQSLVVSDLATINKLIVTDLATIANLEVDNLAVTGSLTVKGGITTAIAKKLSDYTITLSDSIITADATDGTFHVVLPTAVGVAGRQFTIKKTDITTNAVVVDTTSIVGPDGHSLIPQAIDRSVSYTLAGPHKYLTVVSDGTNWIIVGNN